jgi:ethanolamine ammonia-lyase small subunit
LAHARARDAVLADFDAKALAAKLCTLGEPVRVVDTVAHDRAGFLQHPNFGRRIADASRAALTGYAGTAPRCDLAIIVSDGLSTLAVTTQAEPLLAALLPLLHGDGWSLAPLIVARHARVALQDEIGEILRAQISLMLIGERPGLGNADSLGAYFTYAPAVGRTDADRNCVSNIRTGGLSPAKAARKLHALLTRARQLRVSGVALKDETALGAGGPEKLVLEADEAGKRR